MSKRHVLGKRQMKARTHLETIRHHYPELDDAVEAIIDHLSGSERRQNLSNLLLSMVMLVFGWAASDLLTPIVNGPLMHLLR